MAYLGKGDKVAAESELEALRLLAKDDRLKEVTVWDINSVYDLVIIAEKVLSAELYAANSNYDESIISLEKAVMLEDALNYNEPPDWFFSIRHHLGRIQITAGYYDNAIDTYYEDLDRLPKNGWAYYGIKKAYEGLNDLENAAKMQQLFDSSWVDADFDIAY